MRHRREERRKQEDPGREAAARKAVRRAFPGSQHDGEELRVAMERGAYADLVAHAKAFLETEVCGVLVGEVCRDETGLFVSVQAVVRGEAAVSGAASVTFTQATWNRIHETLDRDYPKQQIVGWYHTHPGFGVEFSEMDLFIQGNFFPAETQVALLTDPLSGEVAVCANGEDGTTYLRRFWVDGREHVCKVPAAAAPSTARSHVSEDGLGERIDRLEARVGQALHANGDSQVPCHRVVNKDGRLAPNFAFNGWQEQKRRLLQEGVVFKDQMHVDLKKCRMVLR